ncbi:MAG: undecaprenyl-phosphate glucose phosphotransferase [Chloroflexi bacterium]|nr:undecaprenyl-phosphate glucose phosphotransferase [Chloroflexota bacterium]MCI0643374.1 undecaprenyl-phosphate glucose phosphotransferase [Chloroflexota bacterium]MCI0730075.1 undecaprenyl-phosphate glucose phosphotransferase [Chloroflexota bacterium]
MRTQKIRTVYSFTLVILDTVMVIAAFALAYWVRITIPWPGPLANEIALVRYSGLLLAQIIGVIATLFFYRQYYLPRAISRVDQFYSVFAGVTIGTMMAVALSAFTFKNSIFEVDYPRAMIIYAWLLAIILIMFGRLAHQAIRNRLRDRGVGKDRLLVVGTDEVARIIIQRILWSPQLGYDLVGVVNGQEEIQDVLGVPVLGAPEDLPALIEQHAIDEVIIAMPEKGQREVVRVISYCERGRVSIKVFPDFFQFVASETTINDLGGLPLLSVRDFAMRGYMLVFKRLMDIAGAMVGLVFFSPLMLLTALAIKLESPGPVFFIQERMGLDGRPFLMIKFRSMREDAEREGPGWTTQNDPRQTKLGRLLRQIEFDELPQFINVFLGEMSLVGPRPEQPYYVNVFRQNVPRYMERHREKAGMTGWAQVNGLRGDTSIIERTKYDIWYTENWSVLLDIKIILRTLWQIAKREGEGVEERGRGGDRVRGSGA